MSTPAVSVTNTPRKRPPGVREGCTVDARVATPGAARRGPARSRADTSGRMPRATRARARGALQAKSGAEENVPADVVASHPKAVGAGARGIAAGVSGGAEDALTREMERELEAIEAERESTDAPPRAISTPTDRRGRRGARARGTHRGGFSARVPQQLLTPNPTPFPPPRSRAQWRSVSRRCARRRTISRRSCRRPSGCSSSRSPRRCAAASAPDPPDAVRHIS